MYSRWKGARALVFSMMHRYGFSSISWHSLTLLSISTCTFLWWCEPAKHTLIVLTLHMPIYIYDVSSDFYLLLLPPPFLFFFFLLTEHSNQFIRRRYHLWTLALTWKYTSITNILWYGKDWHITLAYSERIDSGRHRWWWQGKNLHPFLRCYSFSPIVFLCVHVHGSVRIYVADATCVLLNAIVCMHTHWSCRRWLPPIHSFYVSISSSSITISNCARFTQAKLLRIYYIHSFSPLSFWCMGVIRHSAASSGAFCHSLTLCILCVRVCVRTTQAWSTLQRK